MKKNIFLILVLILVLLVLFYLYDKRENILNKEYRDYENNIYIDYPYFNNVVIDNYLNDYLEPFMKKNDLVDLLFIDYDYLELDDRLELMLYIYEEKDNAFKKYSKKIEIDMVNGLILNTSMASDNDYVYAIYNQGMIENTKGLIALTFDDGPNHNTSRVLDILEKYNVKATFFVLGTNILGNEKIIVRMKNLGMEIGNHMYSHKLLTKLEDKEILSEIKQVDNLIFEITGEYPSLIRPSYGTINSRIKRIMDRPIIIWNIDTLDWKYHNSKRISNRVFKNVDDGDIILMHDIYRATSNSLELIIPKLINDGYQFVTVSELLYYKGVNIEDGQVYSSAN